MSEHTAENDAHPAFTVRELAAALCEHGCVAPVVDPEVPYGCRDCAEVARRIIDARIFPPAGGGTDE